MLEKPTAQDILADFEKCKEALYKTAKIHTILIRSPKGSKDAFTKEACDLLTSSGYRIWDYNIQSGDTPDSDMSYYTIYANITNLLKERKSSAYIVLNSTQNTNNVLLQLLYYLRNDNFNTYTISYMVTPVNQWKDTR
ncbi:hypothetical protein SDC9_185469 [bioreactor metagenome]|uniref:Uncharacterized protein n=1 Tax=bioreactor metagenome TaxID=1076179 RepID=A0A645HFY6_9ZZZZ